MTDDMATKAGHTPTPWRAKGTNVFCNKHCIAMCDTDNATMAEMEATAAFIVKACNAYDGLVARNAELEAELVKQRSIVTALNTYIDSLLDVSTASTQP